MANTVVATRSPGGLHVLSLDTTAEVKIPYSPLVGTEYTVETVVIEVNGSGDWGSFIIRGTLRGSGLTGADLKALPYQSGAAGDVAAGEPIIANDIYYVRGEAKELWIDYTEGAGGSVDILVAHRLG